ncbi:fibronectin-like [Protopterus annectens]|uniref:fibronectin-like n=1 Tax=Protopterus annectens TaxID=7888 RepID=UPI001CFBDBAF|nr:fibronectin-like [Protopterus annectens]
MHPQHIFKNVVKGQALRISRLTAEEDTFQEEVNDLCIRFKNRGYKENDIIGTVNEVQTLRNTTGKPYFSHREEPISEFNDSAWNKVKVSTNYTSNVKVMQDVVRKYWTVLTHEPRIREIVGDEPSFQFKNKKSLKRLLCYGPKKDGSMGEHQGTMPCKNCNQCGWIDTTNKFKHPDTEPDIPRSLTITNSTTTSMFLTWTAPVGLHSYYIINTTGSSSESMVVETDYVNITGLIPGGNYSISVSAHSFDGTIEGDSVSMKGSTKPEMPKNLTITNITTTSMLLTWTAPVGLHSYYIINTTGSSSESMVVETDYVNITGLIPGGNYSISVSAHSFDGTIEGDSVSMKGSTKPEMPQNLTITNTTTTSIFLTWTAPVGLHSYYTINTTGHSSESMILETDYVNITGLIPGENYSISVSAHSFDGMIEGDSVSMKGSTKPEMPKNLTIPNTTTTSMFLTWTAPVGLHSYYIVNTTGSSSESMVVETDYVNITGLIPGGNYSISVSAHSFDGTIEGDSVSMKGSTKPEMPKNLTITNTTTTSMFLTWTAPVGLHSYYIINTTGSSSESMVVETDYVNITGLIPGGNYSISVSAHSFDGTIEGDSVSMKGSTKPEMPKNLTITNTTTTSMFLTWTAPVGLHSYYIINTTGSSSESMVVETDYVNITGLIPGGNYSISVSAHSFDGTIEGDSVSMKGSTKPEMPRNLTITNTTTISLFLTWTAPVGLHSYYIINTTGSSSESMVVETDHVNITGLIPGGNYSITVTAHSFAGTIEGESAPMKGSTKPEMPKNLTITNTTTTSLFLTWTAPAGLHSYYKINTTGSSSESMVVETDHVNITGLIPGVNYTISVSAHSFDGMIEGDSVSIKGSTKPEMPRNLTITNTTTTSLFLTWTAPVGLHSYYIINTTGSSSKSMVVETDYVNIIGLIPGGNYSISVSAHSFDGTIEGDSVSMKGSTKPEMPVNLTITNTTTTSLFLTWTAPVGLHSYYIINTTGSSSESMVVETDYVNITGLIPGGNYTISVSAHAFDGTIGGDSVSMKGSTKPEIPRSLTITNTKTTSLFLTWTAPVGLHSYYIINTTGSSSENMVVETDYVNITGLIPGENYSISVSAHSFDGTIGGDSISMKGSTKPEMPRNLTITNATTTLLFLTWTAPVGLHSYYIINTTGSSSESMVVETDYVNITGLIPGGNYSISVSAHSFDGMIEGDSVSMKGSTKPEMPKNLTITNTTTTSLFLTWTAPVGLHSYYIINTTGSSSKSMVVETDYVNITGLIPGGNYSISVSAHSFNGTIEGDSVSMKGSTKPDVIQNLTARNISTTSVLLAWNHPSGLANSYKVQVVGQSSVDQTVFTESTTITNLTAGSNYTFKVLAVAADNTVLGSPIQISIFTKPDVVQNLIANNIDTTSVFLTWNRPSGLANTYKVQVVGQSSMDQTVFTESVTITDLTAGSNYTFKVLAIAADNTTEGSPIQISIFTKPDVVQNLIANNINTTSVFLTWNRPSGLANTYKVQVVGQSSMDQTVFTESRLLQTLLQEATILLKYWQLQLIIQVREALYRYPYSQFMMHIHHYENLVFNFSEPDVVQNLIANNINTTSVFLTWNRPSGLANTYKVQVVGQSSMDQTVFTESATITDLTAGSNYTFKVLAIAADNTSEGSPIQISIFTKPDVVQSLTASNIATTSVFLTWSHPTGSANSYKIQVEGLPLMDHTVFTEFTIISSLTAGSHYTFKVFAIAADNTTQGNSIQISIFTKPDVVSNLTANNVSTTSIFLSWNHPSGNVNSYKVQVIGQSSIEQRVFTESATITNLTPGSNYTFKVFAVAADNITEGSPVQLSKSTSKYKITIF